jgi:hypothetical protein
MKRSCIYFTAQLMGYFDASVSVFTTYLHATVLSASALRASRHLTPNP